MSGAQIVSLNGDTEAAFDDRVDLDEWLNRPSKRIGFHPPIDWADLASKAIIVAGLGACVAMWLS